MSRRLNPTLADRLESPYSLLSRQGICDLGQARGFGDLSKTVALLGEADSGFECPIQCRHPKIRFAAVYRWPVQWLQAELSVFPRISSKGWAARGNSISPTLAASPDLASLSRKIEILPVEFRANIVARSFTGAKA